MINTNMIEGRKVLEQQVINDIRTYKNIAKVFAG